MNKGAANWIVVEATATTATASSSFRIDEIWLLRNDGLVDITFTFDTGASFTLKKGESYQNLPLSMKTLHYITVSGSAAFRAHGKKD